MSEFRVISIGTLEAHPLWNEKGHVRTAHATTTLVTSGDVSIIVNPSLPAAVVRARLSERTSITADQISMVFVTTFAVDHYRGLAAFPRAKWLIHEPEQLSASAALQEQLDRAREGGDEDLAATARDHLELLDRFEVAEDKLAINVDLFPLPGLTTGTCGILLPLPGSTVLITGDAVATIEHLEQGKVLPHCVDVEQAIESFREAVEIADALVPGRDNVILNPLRRLM